MFPIIRIFSLWLVIIFMALSHLVSVAISSQYHIQTDEGPERFFRYQTDNGQFRKEKRLQDGTVIGTEAWIDAAGYLRLKDYIADKHGYRILKSKIVHVGQGTAIQDAIKYSKTISSQSQTSNKAFAVRQKTDYNIFEASRNVQPHTTEAPILGYLTPLEAAKLEPIPYLGYDHYPNELPSYGKGYVRSNANYYKVERTNTDRSNIDVNVLRPGISLKPPLRANTAIGIASTTPAPIAAAGHGLYSSPAPFSNPLLNQINNNNNKGYNYAASSPFNGATFRPIYDRHRDAQDYKTNNGFRYILPHQYHEEVDIRKERKKAGSYGYIDPFGIRRVVYYNASPEKGFVHRNRNRYVGLGADALPYDEPKPTDV